MHQILCSKYNQSNLALGRAMDLYFTMGTMHCFLCHVCDFFESY